MATYESAKNQDPILYCAFFGGPRDGLKTGDLPAVLSGQNSAAIVRLPVSQPPGLYAARSRCSHQRMSERTMGAMTLCIHEFEPGLCDVCENPTPSGRPFTWTSMAGKTFELVHIPNLRDDTYLHLNREGPTWALRWYRSPSEPAVELSRSSRGDVDPKLVGIRHSISYPYSMASDGVTVTDTRYWFDEIAKANAKLGDC